jgi:LPXTG-motif cell wall-anchored protein
VDDEGRALSGAKLQLKSMNADGTFTPCMLLGGADDLSEWTLRLSGGTYRLTETEAPRGYYRTDDAIQFAVSEGIVSDVEISGSAVRYDGACITVINHVGVELPQTGGRGALPFMAAGLLMMAAALAGCGMRRGRERRAGD